jgi:hypothetical protein
MKDLGQLIIGFLFVLCLVSSVRSPNVPSVQVHIDSQPSQESQNQETKQTSPKSPKSQKQEKQTKTRKTNKNKQTSSIEEKEPLDIEINDIKEISDTTERHESNIHLNRKMKRTSGTKRSLESRVRVVVERMFKTSFPKCKPEWLINPNTGKRLELDCYSERLRLAIEINGQGHYHYMPTRYHRRGRHEFEEQKMRDDLKKIICKKQGVKLIVVPYWVNEDELEKFIEKNLI